MYNHVVGVGGRQLTASVVRTRQTVEEEAGPGCQAAQKSNSEGNDSFLFLSCTAVYGRPM